MRYTIEDYALHSPRCTRYTLHEDSDEAALAASKAIPFTHGAVLRFVFREDDTGEIAFMDTNLA